MWQVLIIWIVGLGEIVVRMFFIYQGFGNMVGEFFLGRRMFVFFVDLNDVLVCLFFCCSVSVRGVLVLIYCLELRWVCSVQRQEQDSCIRSSVVEVCFLLFVFCRFVWFCCCFSLILCRGVGVSNWKSFVNQSFFKIVCFFYFYYMVQEFVYLFN